MEVRTKKLRDVKLPTRQHASDAGFDLYASESVTLRPGEYHNMPSGIACAIPLGYAGIMTPRSGFGCKGLVLKNVVGVIDSNYRGEIGLPLFNNNIPTNKTEARTIEVHEGERVAQMLIVKVEDAKFVEVEELDETDRGDCGFGSTGK